MSEQKIKNNNMGDHNKKKTKRDMFKKSKTNKQSRLGTPIRCGIGGLGVIRIFGSTMRAKKNRLKEGRLLRR